jgi:hypothetical protein
MNLLDERARRAARGLHETVDRAELRLMEAGIGTSPPGARPALASRVLAFAGAFVVVLMAAGLAVVQMSIFASDDRAPAGTDPVPPSVIVEAPEESTSTTEPEEPSTLGAEPAPEENPDTTEPEPDTIAPMLQIVSPEDGERVQDEILMFRGVTEPGATVNRGRFEADIDDEGNWSIALVLSSGSNYVTFTVRDEAGNEATASVTVIYDPPSEKEKEGTFTAFATYGSSEFDPPYDIYYGTATPGAKITIASEYGSGSTAADAEGSWEKQVFFPDAPYGKTFLVTVKDDEGRKKTFEFTSYAKA